MSPLMTHTGPVSRKDSLCLYVGNETKKTSSGRVFSKILPSEVFQGPCLGALVPASQQEAQIMIRLLRTLLQLLPHASTLHI